MKDKLDKLAAILREAGDLYTLDDLLSMIEDGRMQSHVKSDSWIVTQIWNYPRKSVLHIVIAVGDIDTIKSMEHTIQDFARAHGCAMLMTSAGRTGWEGEMTPGWRRVGTTFMMEL